MSRTAELYTPLAISDAEKAEALKQAVAQAEAAHRETLAGLLDGLPADFHSTGLKVSPDASLDEMKQIIKRLLVFKTHQTTFSNFVLGDAYNALPKVYGIRKEFAAMLNDSQGYYKHLRKIGTVARAWLPEDRDVTISWAFFEATASLPHDQQLQEKAKWSKPGGRTSIEKLKARLGHRHPKSSPEWLKALEEIAEEHSYDYVEECLQVMKSGQPLCSYNIHACVIGTESEDDTESQHCSDERTMLEEEKDATVPNPTFPPVLTVYKNTLVAVTEVDMTDCPVVTPDTNLLPGDILTQHDGTYPQQIVDPDAGNGNVSYRYLNEQHAGKTHKADRAIFNGRRLVRIGE